jgi:hypothetical protein
MYTTNRQLLCTFTNSTDYRNIIQEIHVFYDVYNKRIFAFSNVKNPKEIYLTYNVIDVPKTAPKFKNTILIHRKKQTNTLYSLNALNTLIKEETGQLDKSFELDWNLYENSLVISGDISVKIIPLKIFNILD